MAKRKNILKKWWKRTFGDKFNIYDVIIIVIMVGYGYYIYSTMGWTGLTELVGDAVFYALIVSFFVSQLIKRAKR